MVGVGEHVERSGIRVIVRGRVQGVGYRWFASCEARRMAVRGCVRNLDDGSVAVDAAGTTETLDAFVERLRAGPPSARVEEVRIQPLHVSVTLPDPFAIVR